MNQIVYFTSSVERKRNRLSPIAVVRTAEKRATETKQSRRSKKKQNKTNKTIKKCTIVFEIIIKRSHYRITTVSRRRDASAARSPPFRKRTFIVAKFLRTRLRRTQKCAPRFRQLWLGWGSKWSPSPNFFYSPQLLLRYAFKPNWVRSSVIELSSGERTFIVAKFLRTRLRRTQECAPHSIAQRFIFSTIVSICL